MAHIKIIGVPMDLGASRRGVDMGPSALRIAKLGSKLSDLGHQVTDSGNISVRVAESMGATGTNQEKQAKYLPEISATCAALSDAVYGAIKENAKPLVLGGDHSIAMGTVAGVSRFYREKSEKIGLIWLDAHADINTPETTVSGNIHGMPVAHILGKGSKDLLKLAKYSPMVEAKNAVLVGIRDLDPEEQKTVKEIGIKAFTMRDIDEMGLRKVMEEAIKTATSGTAGFHCSMDVDWLDPDEAPGVGTPVRGGATYREGHLAMEMVNDSGKMLSLEVTEVNPVLDTENRTANIAVGMVLSAFGKKIL